ncbi:MAG: ABC transporter ATP-binding protein [Clostridium sp.]
MNKLLEVKGLTKVYDHFTLDNINFSLEPGYIMGFVGVNGAGKTTTINLILNAIKRDVGEINIFGMDNLKDEKRIKQKIGVVFDNMFLVNEWNMLDVEKAYKLFYTEWDSEKYYSYLERFRLIPQTKIRELSRGMAVKLILSTALSHDAELLILDEPTSGLDPAARDELMEIFQEYIEDGKKSIIFSTHVTSDLEKIADYITCINQGKIIYTGTKDDLLERYCLIKGGPDEYKEYEKYIIGVRKFSTGFEGLILRENLNRFNIKIAVEKPSIEEIIIFTNKGGRVK